MLKYVVFTSLAWLSLGAVSASAQTEVTPPSNAIPAATAPAVSTAPPPVAAPANAPLDAPVRAELESACRELGYVPKQAGVPDNTQSTPKEIPYEHVTGEPRGYHLEERSRKGMWVSGAAIGGAFYGFALMAAVGSTSSEDRILALPIAGPIIRLTDEREGGTRMLLTLDAAGQVVGATLTYLGLALTKKVWVRNYAVDLALVPAAPGADRGVSLTAQF